MEKNGKKFCNGNSRHIDIRYFFANYRIEGKIMSIAYCSTEHTLTYFLTKALQGALLTEFCDVIMGWKQVDTLQMVTPSTNERVVNVVTVRSNQEEIESNMEIGGERIESSVETEGDRAGYNVETKENDTKKCVHSVETKEKGKEMHNSYADIVRG